MKKVLFFSFFVIFFLTNCKTIIVNNDPKKKREPGIDVYSHKPKIKKNDNLMDEDIGDIQFEKNEKKNRKSKRRSYNIKRKKFNANDLYTANIENLKVKENGLKSIELEENQTFSISLKNQGWILKKYHPN